MSPPSPTPRGPAADPIFLPTTHPSNPYELSPALFHASVLSPKVTSKHVYFFGAEASDPHCCLTQWYPSPFRAPRMHEISPEVDQEQGQEDVLFPTTEHYMMYHKAVLMEDHETAAEILKHAHPSRAKLLGRQVRHFNRTKWKESAMRIVEEANWAKFTQCEDMGEVLVQTGNRVIVEASPEDRIWGVGFDINEAEGRESEWGLNQLGEVLMKVRARLNAQKTDKPGSTEV